MQNKKNFTKFIKMFFGQNNIASSRKPTMPTKIILKRLLAYLGKSKIFLYGILLMLILATLLNAVKPLLLGDIIDFLADLYGKSGSESINFNILYKLLFTLVAVTSLAGISQYIQGFISGMLHRQLIFNLRNDVFNKLTILPLSYNESQSHGDLISRVINDTENVANVLCQNISSLFSSIISIITITAIMLSISPLLTFLIYIFVPASVFLTKLLSKRMRQYYRLKHECLGMLEGNIEENIFAYETLLAYNQRERMVDKFLKINEEYKSISIKSGILSNFVNPLLMILSGITYIIIVFVGAIMAIQGSITIGSIQAFLLYIRQITMPLNGIASTYTQIQTAFASAERFFAIYDALEEENKGTKNPEKLLGEIEMIDLSFAYPFKLKVQEETSFLRKKLKGKFNKGPGLGPVPDRKFHEEMVVNEEIPSTKEVKNVLEDFNLRINAGQKIAIVGETGSGKTSIINLITRFYSFQKGILKIDNIPIEEYELKTLRKNIAIVLQDPFFFSGTIRDNILYSLDKEEIIVHKKELENKMIEAAKSANAHDFIMQLPNGYDTELLVDANNISTGQKQLLALTRAFMKDAPILILDEATANIDTLTEMQIQKAILSLMKNRTCIVIAHRLSTIINMDFIILLDKGKIVEIGKHEQLLEMKGKYNDLYHSHPDNLDNY